MPTDAADAVRRHLEAGPVRLTDLADAVAREARVSTNEAVATVWDLVQAGEVDYRADGTAVLLDAEAVSRG